VSNAVPCAAAAAVDLVVDDEFLHLKRVSSDLSRDIRGSVQAAQLCR